MACGPHGHIVRAWYLLDGCYLNQHGITLAVTKFFRAGCLIFGCKYKQAFSWQPPKASIVAL